MATTHRNRSAVSPTVTHLKRNKYPYEKKDQINVRLCEHWERGVPEYDIEVGSNAGRNIEALDTKSLGWVGKYYSEQLKIRTKKAKKAFHVVFAHGE